MEIDLCQISGLFTTIQERKLIFKKVLPDLIKSRQLFLRYSKFLRKENLRIHLISSFKGCILFSFIIEPKNLPKSELLSNFSLILGTTRQLHQLISL
jgi:hypothetical protein